MPRRERVCQTRFLLAFNAEFILSASRGSGTYRCLILSWKLKFIYVPEVKRKSNQVCFTSYHLLHLLLAKPESRQGSMVPCCPDKATWIWRLLEKPGYLIEIKYSGSVRLNVTLLAPCAETKLALLNYPCFLPSTTNFVLYVQLSSHYVPPK